MYIYTLHIYTHTHAYLYTHIHCITFTDTYTHTYVCLYIYTHCIHIYRHIHMHTYIYIYTACIYTHIYICIYIYMHTYIYIYTAYTYIYIHMNIYTMQHPTHTHCPISSYTHHNHLNHSHMHALFSNTGATCIHTLHNQTHNTFPCISTMILTIQTQTEVYHSYITTYTSYTSPAPTLFQLQIDMQDHTGKNMAAQACTTLISSNKHTIKHRITYIAHTVPP